MAKPKIADNKPTQVRLEAGKTYFFCACGRSAKQPFCDGSHKGSEFTPHQFAVDADKDAFLCMCKHTGNKPYCDGTHKQFGADMVGQEGPGAA